MSSDTEDSMLPNGELGPDEAYSEEEKKYIELLEEEEAKHGGQAGEFRSNCFISTGRRSCGFGDFGSCLLYTSPSPRDRQKSRMPSSA